MLGRKPSFVTTITLLFSLAACASPSATGLPPAPSGTTVRPITDILDSQPEFVDVKPDSATLQVNTSLAVACAVVYGPTSAYGQIATDTDMAGGAHSHHHPLLTGLKPDTLYYARLQGVGPDGTLYRSDEYTFRTPPAESTAGSADANLASTAAGARVAGVSSNYGGGADDSAYGALKAIDGNPGTAWSSNGDGDGAWIEIELAAETRVTRVGFWTRTMGSSAQIEGFQIVTDKGETVGPFTLADAAQIYYFDTGFTARRLKFEAVKSSGGNTGAVAIEIYGQPAE